MLPQDLAKRWKTALKLASWRSHCGHSTQQEQGNRSNFKDQSFPLEDCHIRTSKIIPRTGFVYNYSAVTKNNFKLYWKTDFSETWQLSTWMSLELLKLFTGCAEMYNILLMTGTKLKQVVVLNKTCDPTCAKRLAHQDMVRYQSKSTESFTCTSACSLHLFSQLGNPLSWRGCDTAIRS